jgi:hypothetical protein
VFIRRICDYRWDVHEDQWLPVKRLLRANKIMPGVFMNCVAKSRPRYRGLNTKQIQMLRAYECAVAFRAELDRLGLPAAWAGEEPVLTPYIQSLIDTRRAGETGKKKKSRENNELDADAAEKLPKMSPTMERMKIAHMERTTRIAHARANAAEANAKTISDDVAQAEIKRLTNLVTDLKLELQEANEDRDMWKKKFGNQNLIVRYFEGEFTYPPGGYVPPANWKEKMELARKVDLHLRNQRTKELLEECRVRNAEIEQENQEAEEDEVDTVPAGPAVSEIPSMEDKSGKAILARMMSRKMNKNGADGYDGSAQACARVPEADAGPETYSYTGDSVLVGHAAGDD